jgi:hypothetical protein
MEFLQVPLDPTDPNYALSFEPEDLEQAKAFFEEYGYVVRELSQYTYSLLSLSFSLFLSLTHSLSLSLSHTHTLSLSSSFSFSLERFFAMFSPQKSVNKPEMPCGE